MRLYGFEAAETGAEVKRRASWSDPPDAPLDPALREMLRPTLLAKLAMLDPDLELYVRDELDRRVVTYRDFRGLHVLLEEIVSIRGGKGQSERASLPPGAQNAEIVRIREGPRRISSQPHWAQSRTGGPRHRRVASVD